MSIIRILLILGVVLIVSSGCDTFQKPSEADDTTQARGSNAWWNNRMNQEEMSNAINADRPESANESDNMQTNVGLQP